MPLRNAARKGKKSEKRALEYLCAQYGIALGYDPKKDSDEVDDTKAQWTKSAQSRGVWDFLAWNAKTAFFVQVKSNNPPRPDERIRIENAVVPHCAMKLIMIVKDGVNASKRTRIETYYYYDGDGLSPSMRHALELHEAGKLTMDGMIELTQEAGWYDFSGKRARFCAFGKRKDNGASVVGETDERVPEAGLLQHDIDDETGWWTED